MSMDLWTSEENGEVKFSKEFINSLIEVLFNENKEE
jgi:hypothetical protein